jgi:hypothetical protein
VPLREGLHEGLRAFQLRRLPAGAEDGNPERGEFVREAVGEGRFRADHDEIEAFGARHVDGGAPAVAQDFAF